MGVLGLLSLAVGDTRFTLAAAIVGGLYHGLAGLGHIAHGGRNAQRTLAMLTDLWSSWCSPSTCVQRALKLNSAPERMPVGQRAVMVLSLV